MSIVKRNAIIITVMLFVCVAVYFNWAYNRQEAELESEDGGAAESASSLMEGEPTGLFYQPAAATVSAPLDSQVTDYFTSARLNRQQARDSAISTLRRAAETENATQTAVDEAVSSITVMAEYAVSEAEMEALILAKGFADCLVFLDEDSAIIAVPAPPEGLNDSAVSRITDIALEETGLSTEQIKIIGVK